MDLYIARCMFEMRDAMRERRNSEPDRHWPARSARNWMLLFWTDWRPFILAHCRAIAASASSQFNFQFYFIHLPHRSVCVCVCAVCSCSCGCGHSIYGCCALPFMTIVSQILFFIYFYLRSSLFLNRSIYLICMGWLAGRVGRTSVLKRSSQLINNYEYYIRHSLTRSARSATRL